MSLPALSEDFSTGDSTCISTSDFVEMFAVRGLSLSKSKSEERPRGGKTLKTRCSEYIISFSHIIIKIIYGGNRSLTKICRQTKKVSILPPI